jgi:hypothetical protein
MSDPVPYTAVFPASQGTVLFVSGLLAAEQRRRGSCGPSSPPEGQLKP